MPNPENLKPFEKGIDSRRNLKGRPKMPDLHEVMAEILSEEKDEKTGLQRIVDKLQDLAEKGNIKAAEVLLSRGYGLPKQQIEYSGEMNFNSDPFKQVRDNTDSNTEKKE